MSDADLEAQLTSLDDQLSSYENKSAEYEGMNYLGSSLEFLIASGRKILTIIIGMYVQLYSLSRIKLWTYCCFMKQNSQIGIAQNEMPPWAHTI